MSADPSDPPDESDNADPADESDRRDRPDGLDVDDLPDDAPDVLQRAVRKIEAAYGVNPDLSGREVIEAADGKFTYGTRAGIIEERGLDVAQFRTPASVRFLESDAKRPPVFEFSASAKNSGESDESPPAVYVAPEVADRAQNVLERTLDTLNDRDMFYINADMIQPDRGYPVAISLTEGTAGTENSLETGNMSEREARRPWLLVAALAEPDRYGRTNPDGERNPYNHQATLTELKWRERYQEARVTDVNPTNLRHRGLSTEN
jgi:hypothetical protein